MHQNIYAGSEKKHGKINAADWDTHKLQTSVQYFQRTFYITFIRIKMFFRKKYLVVQICINKGVPFFCFVQILCFVY